MKLFGKQPVKGNRLSILLLCDDNPNHANAILDHIFAFVNYSKHDIHLFNPMSMKRSWFLDFDRFDVVVVHYSLCVIYDTYLAPSFKEKMRRYKGLKIQFIQDDYRWVNKITDTMREIGIHVLFTLVPSSEIHKIWDETRLPGAVKLNTLAGYVPERLLNINTPPLESRSIDIGYRGRILPFWLGRLAQEKVWIGQGVLPRAEKYGLRCDIAWREEDRIYGRRWDQFMCSCRATLGTESGATITDFDGSIERAVHEYTIRRPNADFEEVHREILLPYEGNVRMNIISPKIFEAIAMRTALILFPGEYSGIMKPLIHYIPLNKDFSNFDDVMSKLQDNACLRDLTMRAYDDIIASGRYSYQSFIAEFDQVVIKYAAVPRRKAHRMSRYRLARLERPLSLSFFHMRRKLIKWVDANIRGSSLGGSSGEIIAALTLILQSPPLQSLLAQCLRNYRRSKGLRLKTLIKELFLLGLLDQAHSGTLAVGRPFSVSVNFSPDEGSLVITSHSPEREESRFPKQGSDTKNKLDSRLLWSSIYSALQNGRIKKMVWDHSPVSGEVSYVKKPFAVCIVVGELGVREFSSVVQLTSRLS